MYGLNGSRFKVQRLKPQHAARNIRPIELKPIGSYWLSGL